MPTLDDIEIIRRLCEASAAELPFRDANEISSAFEGESEHLPPSLQWFAERLNALIVSTEPTGIYGGELRRIADTFSLENAIGKSTSNWSSVLTAIANCISNGANLRPFAEAAWRKAIDIGRAVSSLNLLSHPNARVEAVTAAGKRLHEQGYRLAVADNAYVFESGEIERATQKIRDTFAEIGAPDCLSNLFAVLKRLYPYDFEMYLPARRYSPGLGLRDASIPFGFLINLAVAAPIPRHAPNDFPQKFVEALNLARDVVSALNLEAFSGFAYISTSTAYLEKTLRELALYDHLFLLRQWRFPFTSNFLTEFFATDHDQVFRENLGWTPSDVAELCRGVEHFATKDPNVITMDAMHRTGMNRRLLDLMLPHFIHQQGTLNANYNSPFAAAQSNFMFKPFVQLGANYILLPAASLMGPAFYEATISSLRPFLGRGVADTLQGDGTERVVLSLFRRASLYPTFLGAEYDLGPNEEGECDLIFETNDEILFVECKAKALTRGAMAGIQGGALLDFAAGTVLAQTQALRHERILRSRGQIDFKNGERLELKRRRITRLSVTLLDHGALQDKMTFANVYGALLQGSIAAPPQHPQSKLIKELNKCLDSLRSEVVNLESLGQQLNAQRLGSASLSVGQLEVLLDGVSDLEQFRKRFAQPVTTMSLNPLFEYYNLRKTRVVS